MKLTGWRRSSTGEQGSAVLLALVFMVLLTMIGTGLITMTNTERAAADNFLAGTSALYAADALAQHVVNELGARTQWTSALCCSDGSSFSDASVVHMTTWREEVDMGAITRELQQRTDTAFGGAPNRPVWRPYAWGSIDALVGDLSGSSPAFLMAWVADDRADGDDDPLADTNGVILIRAQAIGVRGLRRTLELVLKHAGTDSSESSDSNDPGDGSDADSPADVAGNLRELSPQAASDSSSGSQVQILSWREVQ